MHVQWRCYIPTTNLVFRLICKIKLNPQSWLNSNVEIIRDMTYRMIEEFDKYWAKMNGLLTIASMLDPRNQMDHFDFYFNEITRVRRVEKSRG